MELKSHKTYFKRLIAIAVCSLSAWPLAAQNKEAEEYKVDSALYVYYQRCKENLQSPVVLAMADTLFKMAGEKGDQRMQAVALCTNLDYYYFHGQEDSILIHVSRVKDFARSTKQPKYYYFAWGKRLIQFYIKQGKINTALYEADKMLKEAQKDDDKEGLASCYNILSSIYKIRGFEQQVFEARQKEVELIETYGLDKYNITLAYGDIANYYLLTNNPDKALEALHKAESYATSVSHEIICKQYYIRYYLRLNSQQKALQCLLELEHLFETDKSLASNRKSLYSSQYFYYLTTKQYDKAMEALDNGAKEQARLGEDYMAINYMKNKGLILHDKGDMRNAATYLRKYINAKDSIDQVNDNNASTEFATLLGIEKLNSEKNELALKAKENQLHYVSVIILLLAACLGAVFIFLYRMHRLNRRLKNSESELILQNSRLIESEEKLSAARDEAERASMMKSIFIRNMTHEIRTPLNSIIGFSHILIDMAEDRDDLREFATVIEDSNRKLLKLVEDVLDISDLESGKVLNMQPVDVNKCCIESIRDVAPYVQKDVILDFHPSCEELTIESNPERVSQILFNLLHNASKATEKGSIVLSYELEKERKLVIFTITDTGRGIPADKRDEVFERFVKVDDFSQGLGLGLSICKLLARRMGGDLTLDSGYTGGCRFIFTLPFISENAVTEG